MRSNRRRYHVKKATSNSASEANVTHSKEHVLDSEGSSWNAESGGSAISWLQKKIGVEQQQSRGAIDFLRSGGGKGVKNVKENDEKSSGDVSDPIAMLNSKLKKDDISLIPKEDIPVPQDMDLMPSAPEQSDAVHRTKIHEQCHHGRQRGTGRQNRHGDVTRVSIQQVKSIFCDDPEMRRQLEENLASSEALKEKLRNQYSQQNNVRLERYSRETLDIPVIMELIDQHDVTFICSDTGSGKSTGVPKALLELGSHTKVVSTQPRRTATTAIANRVADLRCQNVGDDVGYWIRGDKKGNDDTRLWYMTSYTLLLNLLSSPLKPPFTHIILDEFHERQADLEVIVSLLKICLKNKTADFKLIIMSATLNTDDWEAYFGQLTVAAYKQSEPEHQIHDYFMDDVCSMLAMPYTPPTGFTQTADNNLLTHSTTVVQNLLYFLGQPLFQISHSILVFVPGRAQVEALATWVDHHLSYRFDVIRWHSAVDLHVIEAAIRRPATHRQKLYIATDIAECSITLPDVVFVIDTGMVKRPHIDCTIPATVLYPPLVLQWISKGSVSQRRGRVGRVQQGFYFCLIPKGHVLSLMDFASPPIEHSRIDALSLHCLQLVSNPVAIFTICRGQPQLDTIAASMSSLKDLGCIMEKADHLAEQECVREIHNNEEWSPLIMKEAQNILRAETSESLVDEYVVTFIGRLLQLIPVSAQQGMLVFYGFLTGLESLMIITAAVTSSMTPFVPLIEEKKSKGQRKKIQFDAHSKAMDRAEEQMRKRCQKSRCDILAVVDAFISFRKEKQIDEEEDVLRNWATKNQLSYERLCQIAELEEHIKFELAAFIPFRDVTDANVLENQLAKLAPLIPVLLNAAFASQALEVTCEGCAYTNQKEAARGVFSTISAVPDLHAPSCLRWELGDIVVPVTVSVHFSKTIVAFSTATKVHKQFYSAVLFFSHRLEYCMDSDTHHIFRITYCGTSKYIRVDNVTAEAILKARKSFSLVCLGMRLRYTNREMPEEKFSTEILLQKNLPPFVDLQRKAMQLVLATLSGDILDMELIERDPSGQEEIISLKMTETSLLSFDLKQVGQLS